jgi:hypothetical protein
MHFSMWPVLALSLSAFGSVSARTASIIAAIFIGVPAWTAIWVLVKERLRR